MRPLNHPTNEFKPVYGFLKLFIACFYLGGCINTVTVEKFTGTEKGFRYALPRPYILVTPRADGGIDIQPIMLPDSDNEYVIRTSSILSSYRHDLVFEQGLLKSVTGKQDTSALAAQIATNTGAVMKSRVEAQISAAADAAKKRADAAKAVNDAQLEYDQAVAELNYLKQARADSLANKEGKVEVKDSQIIDAEVKVARAKQKLGDVTGVASNTFDLPGTPPGKIAEGQAWGPMLFAVIEGVEMETVSGRIVERQTVKLQAVNLQKAFKTIALPTTDKNKPQTSGGKAEVELSLKPAPPYKPDGNNKISFSIISNQGLADVSKERTQIRVKNTNAVLLANQFSMTLKDEGREIAIEINGEIASGTYTITPAIIINRGDNAIAPKTFEFEVQR